MTVTTEIDRELARALVDCALDRRSGVVTALRGKLKRLFCVERGELVFATSNVIEEQFSEYLVEQKLLSVAELAIAQQAADRQGLKLTRVLADKGALDEPTLNRALETHFRELLFATLSWPDGEASLARGRPQLGGELTVRVDCIPLLIGFARSQPASLDELRARVGSPATHLEVRDERRALLEGHDVGPVARQLLEACDGTLTVEDLVDRTPGDEPAVWRALYTLLLIGALEPSLADATLRAETLTRQEVLERLARAEHADHYGMLELGPSTPGERIRQSYYLLARRYHPDRFRAGPLADLIDRIEQYFARVTEAYNTLINPNLRAAYDEQLAASRAQKPEQDTRYLARENYRRGRELIAKGRLQDAMTSLENAVQLEPRNASYRLELGRLLLRNPRLRQRAEEHLVEANRIDPSLVDGYLALGDLYAKSQRGNEAIAMFREVLRWEPGHVEATERLRGLGVG